MIVALDIASRSTGVCSGEPNGPVSLSTISLPQYGNDIGGMCIEFEKRVSSHMLAADVLAFEKPLVSTGKLNLITLRKLYSLAAMAEIVAINTSTRAVEVNTQSGKVAVYGKGGKKPGNWCELAQQWGVDPKNDDEADAFGIWLVAVKLSDPKAFAQWERVRSANKARAGETLI